MIRLSTIGPPAVFIKEKPISATNDQIVASVLFLVAEGGKPVSRKQFAEMFFPEADRGDLAHSGRQLVYRLRKCGVPLTGDSITLTLAPDAAIWDVSVLLARGTATGSELASLQGGYLAGYRHQQSDRFTAWLEEHRSRVTGDLRLLLLRQMQVTRAKKDFRALQPLARACLALDPLNEEATLAAAESLAAAGAKSEALRVLDQYVEDVGPRAKALHVAPKMLRERITAYLGGPDTRSTAMAGRKDELATLMALIEQSAMRNTRGCFVCGPAGIGKTRLIEEACSAAALSGHAVARVRLTRHDAERPFAIVRDLGPALLELPGAIGAAPEALAAVRGLCGRGPSQYSRRPENAAEARAIAADVRSRVVDLVDAVSDEQPLIIWIEDADHIDEASTELIGELANDRRRLCLITASRRPLVIPEQVAASAALSELTLGPLSAADTMAVLSELFREANRNEDGRFTENAVRVSAGIPLFVHLLFRNFLVTGDPVALPSTLSDSLSARLDELSEPAKSLFDAVVILGPHSTEAALEAVTQLPRYSLALALRTLHEQGFTRHGDGTVLPAHELLSASAQHRMPVSVARLLHRSAAMVLQQGRTVEIDPLGIALHWEACGEADEAIGVLHRSAIAYTSIGRPHEAIALLNRAKQLATSRTSRQQMDAALLDASHAAGEDHLGVSVAEGLGLYSGSGPAEQRVLAFESLVGAGRPTFPHREELEPIAANQSLEAGLRGRAARLLVMIAEDVAREAIAKSALGLIEDLKPNSIETIIPRLIYETVFGSLDHARTFADELHLIATADQRLGSRLQGWFTACFALWRCGEWKRAIELSEQAFAVAQSHKIWSACTNFASMIANICWVLDQRAAAVTWLETTQESLNRSGGPDRGFQSMGLRISVALENNDPAEAQAILDRAEALFPVLRSNRLGLSLLANRIAIRLVAGETPTESETEQLRHGHLQRRGLGLQDFLSDITVGALESAGRRTEASDIREAYLMTFRRDRFPVSNSHRYLLRLPR